MSWDSYISDQLIAAGTVSSAAIVGHDGTTWAASAGFAVSQSEVQDIMTAFSEPDKMRASGMYVNAEKYFFLGGSEEVLRGRKGEKGVHVAKTNQAVIIALYQEPVKGGACAQTVEALGDYLKGVGY